MKNNISISYTFITSGIILALNGIVSILLLMNNLINQPNIDSVVLKDNNIIINNGEEIKSIFEAVNHSFFIGFLFVVITVLFLALKIKGENFYRYLNINSSKLSTIIISKGILSIFIWFAIVIIFVRIFPELETSFVDNVFQNSNPLLLFITICILTPIGEEMLFRGFLFKSFSNLLSPKNEMITVFITSFLFTMLHFQYNIYILFFIFVLGIILGIARMKTSTILTPILMHIIYNSLIFTNHYL